jgi:hypothetical protein
MHLQDTAYQHVNRDIEAYPKVDELAEAAA